MTTQELIHVISEYFEEQVSCGNLTEAPDAAKLAYHLIGKCVRTCPVSTGDKLYWLNIIENTVMECTVTSIDEDIRDFEILFADGKTSGAFFSAVGDMYFHTKELALYALETGRDIKLQQLRDYYIREKEWDTLRELEQELKIAERVSK